MILLDTNIVSEVMRIQPNINVIKWLNNQDSSLLFLSSITIAEIGYGLYILPNGKRKKQLQLHFDQFIKNGFDYRILEFTEHAARKYASVMGGRKIIGRPLNVPDGQIASIALENGFSVATRNIKDFEEYGLKLINPFDANL
jgi:predicted nucleic acid-binding protein